MRKRRWKKESAIPLLAAAAVCLSSCSRIRQDNPPEERTGQTVMLRLAETMPENHPSARAAALFAQLAEERSGGRIKIRIYYQSELGSSDELMEQLEFGGVPLVRVSALDLTDCSGRLREAFAPGNFSSMDEQMAWVREHQEELQESLREENITPLVWYYPDSRCFYSSKTGADDPVSLEGRKVQASQTKLMADFIRSRGGEVVGTTALDPYKLFNSGNIDCAESAFAEYICGNYVQYSKSITVYRELYFPDVILINSEIMEGLDEDDQELIRVCAEATYEYQKSQLETLHTQWEKELKENLGVIWKEDELQ